MVRVGRVASSIGQGAGRRVGSSASAIARGFKRPSLDASSFKRIGEGLSMSGRRAGSVARRSAYTAVDAAKRAGTGAKSSISRGADSLTTGAKRQARDAGDWIATSSKIGMKRMGKMCRANPAKCSAGMLLAGYTAVNLAENSQAQQECIARCLPPNWPVVVDSDGAIAPEYHLHDPKHEEEPTEQQDNRLSIGPQQKKDKTPKQPQCTDGTDCEPYCIAACKAEHPTTIIGAAMEGAGEIMDGIIVPIAEDVFGIPITDIGGGFMGGIRIAVFLVGVLAVYKVVQMMGRGRRNSASNGGGINRSVRPLTPRIPTAVLE